MLGECLVLAENPGCEGLRWGCVLGGPDEGADWCGYGVLAHNLTKVTALADEG
ncbi:hypothetical protein [Actinoplanes sp. GCM10030250]|uniref:hypothetical protein n=1 Tax=Actinoplanes sp. GCM10030250 TaxID=3273376 RepID=UPI00361AD22E